MQVDSAFCARVDQLARAVGVTRASLLQGAYMALLARLAGSSAITIGATRTGRHPNLPGIERAIGLFIETLPVHRPVPPSMRVDAWLRDLQTALAEQESHAHLGLATIRKLAPCDDTELFEALYVYEGFPVDADTRRFADMEIAALEFRDTTHYPVAMAVVPQGDAGMTFSLTYLRSRLDDAGAEAFLRHLRRLLELWLDCPQARLGDGDLLDAAERRALLERSGHGADRHPQGRATLPELFEATVARAPDAAALVYGDTEIGFGDLDARANRLARLLRAQGAGPETIVAVALERSPELIVAILAVLKAGAAFLPLDIGHPPARNAALVRDSGARLLVSTTALATDIDHAGCTALALDDDATRAVLETMASDTLKPGERALRPDSLAYLIFTSGSTGTPKAVAVAHAGVVNLVDAQREGFAVTPADRVLQFASLAFDAAVSEILSPCAAAPRSCWRPGKSCAIRRVWPCCWRGPGSPRQPCPPPCCRGWTILRWPASPPWWSPARLARPAWCAASPAGGAWSTATARPRRPSARH